jgi:hypothetical protein
MSDIQFNELMQTIQVVSFLFAGFLGFMSA